jgi:ketosteroid isomerase-like protein
MDLESVIDRSLQTIESGNWDGWRDLVDPDARFRVHPGEEQGRDEILASVQRMATAGIRLSYSNIRRIVAPEAVVEEHDTTFTLPDGDKIVVEACVIYRFENGKISRVDEYLDGSALEAIRNPS